MPKRKICYLLGIILDLFIIFAVLFNVTKSAKKAVQETFEPMPGSPARHEVFGFAPFWTLDKLENADLSALTSLAYFGIPVRADGNLEKNDTGYTTLQSDKAAGLFYKAHKSGTKVILTLTQMENPTILAFLEDKNAQTNAINQAVEEVKNKNIDGINIDFEYLGDPGDFYRNRFSSFVANMTKRLHEEIPGSKLTVSVYASSAKEPKLYDVAALGKASDGLFIMAYDFAVASSDNAIPTAPLYGHKEGQYWYDISCAVDDFLTQVSPQKLILGVPWYGYNYLVYKPEVSAITRPNYSWRGRPVAQTYAAAQDNVNPQMDGIDGYQTGWDDFGKVSWVAYHVIRTNTWRMLFLDDTQSLSIKYDFAKNKNLKGVGIWALGFEEGKKELWDQLKEKFGENLAETQDRKEANAAAAH